MEKVSLHYQWEHIFLPPTGVICSTENLNILRRILPRSESVFSQLSNRQQPPKFNSKLFTEVFFCESEHLQVIKFRAKKSIFEKLHNGNFLSQRQILGKFHRNCLWLPHDHRGKVEWKITRKYRTTEKKSRHDYWFKRQLTWNMSEPMATSRVW